MCVVPLCSLTHAGEVEQALRLRLYLCVAGETWDAHPPLQVCACNSIHSHSQPFVTCKSNGHYDTQGPKIDPDWLRGVTKRHSALVYYMH